MRIGDAVRTVASLAPLLGLVARPARRPDGITALVRVKGEEDWLEPSLLSVRELADEILVLDNGAGPETRRTLARLTDTLADRLHVERCPGLDLVALSNLGLDRARFRWVMRWDADFVGHTEGPGDLRRLRQYLLGLDRRRFYVVHVPAAEVAGDLRHQFPDRRLRLDGSAHVASPRARYARVERDLRVATLSLADRIARSGPPVRVAFESLSVPRFYRVLRWPTVAYFHVHVERARPALLRHFWLEWLRAGDPVAYPTLDAYALAQARRRWGIDDLEAAARYYMTLYCRALVPLDHAITGPYPTLLAPDVDEARYEVVRSGGVITGRREALPC
jgi:hypothetical protein